MTQDDHVTDFVSIKIFQPIKLFKMDLDFFDKIDQRRVNYRMVVHYNREMILPYEDNSLIFRNRMGVATPANSVN